MENRKPPLETRGLTLALVLGIPAWISILWVLFNHPVIFAVAVVVFAILGLATYRAERRY